MASLPEQCRLHLTESLRECVQAHPHERCCIILSGGVDTSAIACAAAAAGIPIDGAITVFASDTATDRPYAGLAAQALNLKHHVIEVTLTELLARRLPFCVRALRTFDGMELRNALVVAEALQHAAQLGFQLAITGDAADELLGGYRFTWGSDDPVWSEKRSQMCSQWTFCAPRLAAAIPGSLLAADSPYMRDSFKAWALRSTSKAACILSLIHI